MKILSSWVLQLLGFGVLTAFLTNQGEQPSAAVIMLFVIAELAFPAALCSLILRRFDRARLSDGLTAVIAGFVLSHFAILIALRVGPLAGHAAESPATSTLAWMDLTMRVALFVLLAITAAALLRPLATDLAVLKLRVRRVTALVRSLLPIRAPDHRA